MQSNDYGESWTKEPGGFIAFRRGILPDYEPVSVCQVFGPDHEKLQERIIACVNHCAGIPTEELLKNAR